MKPYWKALLLSIVMSACSSGDSSGGISDTEPYEDADTNEAIDSRTGPPLDSVDSADTTAVQDSEVVSPSDTQEGGDTNVVPDSVATPDTREGSEPDAVADSGASTDTDVTMDTEPADDTNMSADTGPDVPSFVGSLAVSTSQVVALDACAPVQVLLSEAQTATTDVTLAGVGQAFFSDSGCSVANDTLTIAAAETQAGGWVKPAAPGVMALTASAPDWEPANWSFEVSTDTYALDERPDETVVLYNVHAAGGLEIATYYAERRAIDPARLCPLELPRGQYATPDQLLAARQSALNCLCDLAEITTADCVPSMMSQIVPASGVTHLVLTRGIPARLTGTPWESDFEEPSFDFYFAHLLAKDGDLFAEGTMGYVSIPYDKSDMSDVEMRPKLQPVQHHSFATSRVEAISVERTLDLIDRTLASEEAGFQGNIASEAHHGMWAHKNPGRFFTSTFDSACHDYLLHEPFVFGALESSWPTAECRWGTTMTYVDGPLAGMMPGFVDTTIPETVNVTWFTGNNPRKDLEPINNHSAFHDFNTMLNWRKTHEECVPECADMPDATSQAACEAASTDYFRVLNTDCVGVAPGFMGQQVRSYPVGYYGFFPPGWTRGGGGNSEASPPQIREGGAFQSALFTDDRYLHFGEADLSDNTVDSCTDLAGELVPCPEKVAVNLMRTFTLPSPIEVVGEERIQITYRYRNPGASTSSALRLHVCTNNCNSNNLKTVDGTWPSQSLVVPATEWTEATHTIAVPESDTTLLKRLRIYFDGRFPQNVQGFFDLDAIEVRRESTGELLSVGSIWSFADTKLRTNTSGASAADVIDRMGGIAYWGSSSHHITGGWAWYPTTSVARNVFGGRTLGEALVDKSGKSGIAFGDPLYRGYAVKIYTADETPSHIPWARSLFPEADAFETTLLLNVLQGTAHTHSVRWTLSTCTAHPVEACEGNWEPVLQGVGAVRGHSIPFSQTQQWVADEKTYLRLRAWQVEQPDNHISAYIRLRVHAPGWVPPTACNSDFDENGVVDADDAQEMIPWRVCDEAKLLADFSGNGVVDLYDALVIADGYGGDDMALDLDQDGVVGPADVDVLMTLFCGLTDPSGQSEEKYDVNEDGLVDDLDLELTVAADGYDDCPCEEPAFCVY